MHETLQPPYMQAICVLNHGGVCASYMCAWKYLRKLTEEARYHQLIQSGHWTWSFDNVNLQQKVKHEREGIASSNSH